MIDKIRNEPQYNQIMALIEVFITKATQLGGFSGLSDDDKDELSHLSSLAEQYEDEVLKIMPSQTRGIAWFENFQIVANSKWKKGTRCNVSQSRS
jgi:hypothetical protein